MKSLILWCSTVSLLLLPVSVAEIAASESGDASAERFLSQFQAAAETQDGSDIEIASIWRQLEETDTDTDTRGGNMGARCGLGRPACQSPLDCTNLGFVLGSRCAPVTCLREEIELRKQQNNNELEQWQQDIFAEAGITEADILDELATESAEGSDSDKSTKSYVQSLRNSKTFLANQDAILRAAEAHPEYTNTMQDIIRKCTSTTNSTDGKATDVQLFYYGLHIEAGIGVDASYSSVGGNLDMECCPFGRICLGGAYVGASLGVNLGVFLPGRKDTSLIPCGYFMAELDLGVVLAGSFSFGVGFQGYTFLEFGLGVGFGGGAGGSLCYIFAGGIDLPV